MRIFLAFGLALLIGLMLLFWHPAPPALIDDNPDLSLSAFAGCTVDTDCLLVALPCGETGAARQSQHRYVQDRYNDLMTRMRCPMPVVPPRAPHRAVCMDNICVALPDNVTEHAPQPDQAEPQNVP
jgi:hypothetical protein